MAQPAFDGADVLRSPGSVLEAHVGASPTGRLQYWVIRIADRVVLIEPSPLGVTVDGVDLGDIVKCGPPDLGVRDETYPTRGWHTLARDRATTLALPITHVTTGTSWSLEARLFDDGFAYRYVVPASDGPRVVSGEASSWTLPANSRVWLAERNNDWKLMSYAGWWIAADVDALPTISSQGPVQAPPLVVELASGGYLAISEAALTEYSGMRLRAIGNRTVRADFTEGDAGFSLDGAITSPWRVTLATTDLNALVNSDIWTNLNPPPDPDLYPDLSWIRTGPVTWRWWSSGTGNPDQEQEFIDCASRLGWKFTLVDDGWERWPDKWRQVSDLVEYGRSRSVSVLVWKDYNDGICDPAGGYSALASFLDGCVASGVAGVKIDFMNAESLDRIRFEQAALRMTASRRLLLLFHGCQKPTGESRTYPHEVTREGIRGLELNKMSEGPIPPWHNAALPFTRYLTGHADYTPVGFSNPGPTTWGHQIATSILFTSPMNVIAEHPGFLLDNPAAAPALDLLKSLPTTWDETIVLPVSRIGRLAAMARRRGNAWYIAALTGDEAAPDLALSLSFLPANVPFAGYVIASGPEGTSLERREVEGLISEDTLSVNLACADGIVAVLKL